MLAHVIRRPIVVIADPMLRDADGEPLQPSPFGGVYLPLLDRPEVCHHDPLLLAYSNSHFSALVPMSSSGNGNAGTESTQIRAIPLVDWSNQLLPVHFALDPTNQWRWGKDENDPKKVRRDQEFCLIKSDVLIAFIVCDQASHDDINLGIYLRITGSVRVVCEDRSIGWKPK